MQTTISTTLDNQIASLKANKSPSTNLTQTSNQTSFNQLLNREISAQKNTPTNSINNKNNSAKVQVQVQSPPANTPSQPAKVQSESTINKTTSDEQKEEDKVDSSEVKHDETQNVSAQLLAMMGNLNPATKNTTDENTSRSDTASGLIDAPNNAIDATASGGDQANIDTDTAIKGSNSAADQITDKFSITGTQAASDIDKKSSTHKSIDVSKINETEQALTAHLPADLKTTLNVAQKNSSTKITTPTAQEEGVASTLATTMTLAANTKTELDPQTALQQATPDISTNQDGVNKTDTLIDRPKVKDIALGQQEKTTDLTNPLTGKEISASKDAFSQQISATRLTEANQEKQAINTLVSLPTAAINNLNAPVVNAVAGEQIAPRVGVTGWDKAIGQKVIWMVGEGMQSAELTLNPPDLGPLQVVLSVSNDQASANFFSAQPEVREALESALPRLRQMMTDAGVQLNGFSVNSQASNQGQGFSGQSQEQGSRYSRTSTLSDIKADVIATPISRVTSKIGVVDTFV